MQKSTRNFPVSISISERSMDDECLKLSGGAILKSLEVYVLEHGKSRIPLRTQLLLRHR